MKKQFIFILSCMVFLVGALSPAQERKQKAEPGPKAFVGKVTQANERTADVTMVGANGEKVTLNFSRPRTGSCPRGRKPPEWVFPKVGDVFVARVSSDCDDCLATC
ncbi:MAG TPA: hypothetical protein VGL29_07505 [Blastocatellia bacterium]|jgi:hypothetical protein